ncbi:MAG: hypothetical protein E2O83_04935 [Bacteroidetes bacterium]|nr:MAG: hypothetical protein E2O83_04935 [Bacteroidota bacterium]
MKLIIQLVLWVIIIFLGWQLYNSVIGPVQFNKKKVVRYEKVIAKLKDIKAAQMAYQEINGGFSGDFDSLVRFLDTAQFAITERRDSSYADVAKNKAYGIDEGYYIDVIVVDTLNFASVKDSLFRGDDRYKTIMNVPDTDAKFEMKAGKLDKNGILYSVFEAKVVKNIVLKGLDKDLIKQEEQINSVDGVNGPYIKVGSLTEISTSGNWPKLYDKKAQ